MISYSRLLDALSVIPDPRRAQGRRFPLPYLLLFSVLAVLSGAKSFTHIVIFMRERREVLNQVFGSEFKSAPSINTVRLLLHAIGGEPLEATVRGYKVKVSYRSLGTAEAKARQQAISKVLIKGLRQLKRDNLSGR